MNIDETNRRIKWQRDNADTERDLIFVMVLAFIVGVLVVFV